MASSAQLERKAERARERLSDRIADLHSHVSPTAVVSDLLEGLNTRAWGDEFLPILAKQARNNPIASLLIAAGVDESPANNSPRTKEKVRAAQQQRGGRCPGQINVDVQRPLART